MSGTVASARVADGADGTTYTVTVTANVDDGDVLVGSLAVQVRSDA